MIRLLLTDKGMKPGFYYQVMKMEDFDNLISDLDPKKIKRNVYLYNFNVNKLYIFCFAMRHITSEVNIEVLIYYNEEFNGELHFAGTYLIVSDMLYDRIMFMANNDPENFFNKMPVITNETPYFEMLKMGIVTETSDNNNILK